MRCWQALLGAALLSGCAAVGPDYRVPEAALVKAPQAQGAFLSGTAATRPEPLPDHWWRLYDDPTLDGLIAQALAANTDLRVAEANLSRSEALLREAGASRQIQASADIETSWAQRSAEAELQHVEPPERQIYNGGVTIGYDLDLFGGIRRGIEAATADTEAAAAARDLVRVNVAAETARAYAEICNAGHQIAVLKQAIDVLDANRRLTRILVEHGRAAPFELDRRNGLVETSRAGLPRLEAMRRNAAFRLATLMGHTPSEVDRRLLLCDRPLVLGQPIPVGNGQALLRRRPDIRMAERHLAATTARIGVATAALYPDIKLGASIGSTGAAADLLSPLTNRFGLGPMISWTVNRSAARARIAAAEAQSRGDLAAFDGIVLKALREVESALDTYAADLDQQRNLESARDDASRVVRQTEHLRRGGKIGEQPALDAERDLVGAEQAAANGLATLNQDQITLFLALGGGWTTGKPTG